MFNNATANEAALLDIIASKLSQHHRPTSIVLNHQNFSDTYSLTFPDATKVIVRLFTATTHGEILSQSEVATMAFARSHYQPAIPVPQVVDWEGKVDNPVGAPYIIIQQPAGQRLDAATWAKLSFDNQMPLLRSLAKIHARLTSPVPFNAIGNIFFQDGITTFHVGKLLVESDGDTFMTETPASPLSDIWTAKLDAEFLAARSRLSGQYLDSVISERNGVKHTIGDFCKVHSDLTEAVAEFNPLPEGEANCLIHRSFGIGNVFFDEKIWEITGVFGWGDACILPITLFRKYAVGILEGRRDDGKRETNGSHWEKAFFLTHACSVRSSRFRSEVLQHDQKMRKLHDRIFGGWERWLDVRRPGLEQMR